MNPLPKVSMSSIGSDFRVFLSVALFLHQGARLEDRINCAISM